MYRWRTTLLSLISVSITLSACSPPLEPALLLPLDAVPLQLSTARVAVFDSTARNYLELDDRTRLVIRDSVQWRAVWASGTSHYYPLPSLPSVDFDTEMVLIVAMGVRSTGGYHISINGTYESPGAVFVQVRETAPGERCVVDLGGSKATAVRVVPRRDRTVHFLEESVVHRC